MGALSSPQLDEMRTVVRRFLNQESSTNTFWSNAELDSYLNEATRLYMAELLQMGEGHFVKQADLDIVGSDLITLPTDFFKVRAVYKKLSNGYEILPYDNNVTSGYSTNDNNNSNTYRGSYYIRNNNTLVLRPGPNFSETGGIRVEYIALPDTLDNDSDTLPSDISALFKQCIEMYAVYKAKVKESLNAGSDTSGVAERHLSVLNEQFRDAIQIRSQNPTSIQAFNPEDC